MASRRSTYREEPLHTFLTSLSDNVNKESVRISRLQDTNFNWYRLTPKAPLAKAVPLGPADSLKIILTAKDGSKAARPHQAFLMLQDQDTGLETSFPFSVKDTGKGKVEIVGVAR